MLLLALLVSGVVAQTFPCAARRFALPYSASSQVGTDFAATSGGVVMGFSNNTAVYNVLIPPTGSPFAPPPAVLVGWRSDPTSTDDALGFAWSPSGDRIFWSDVEVGRSPRTRLFVSSTAAPGPAAPTLFSHAAPATGAAYVASLVTTGTLGSTSYVLFTANAALSCVTHLFSSAYRSGASPIVPVQLSSPFAPACSGPTFAFSRVLLVGTTVVLVDPSSLPNRLYRVNLDGTGGGYLQTPAHTGMRISDLQSVPGNSVLFTGSVALGLTQNLFTSPLDGGAFTNVTNYGWGAEAGVRGTVSVVGSSVFFLEEQPDLSDKLVSAALAPAGAPTVSVVYGARDVQQYVVTSDGSRAVVAERATGDVTAVAVGSGAVTVLSTGALVSQASLRMAPSSQHVIFTRDAGAGNAALFAAPVNASAAALRLGGAEFLNAPSGVVFTPDSRRAVFWTSPSRLLVSASLSNATDQPTIATGVAAEAVLTPFLNSYYALYERADAASADVSGPWATCAMQAAASALAVSAALLILALSFF